MDILSTSGIKNMVNAYSRSERSRYIAPLQARKTRYDNLTGAWNKVDKNLDELKSFLSSMESDSNSVFKSKKTELSTDKFLNVTAGENSPTGSFSLRVNQLAKNDILVSKSMAAKTEITTLGGIHEFKITSGENSKVVSVELTNSETNDSIIDKIAKAINSDKDASEFASAASFNPSTSTSKLSLSSKKSGYDNRLIIENVSGGLLDHIGLTAGVLTGRTKGSDSDAGFMYKANSETDNELNSKLNFNGINVQRNDNTFSDLVDGVTFNVKAVMQDTDADVNVSISNDTASMKDKIKGFIEKFNKSYGYIKGNYTSGKQGRGIFTGDSVAMSIMNNFRKVATERVEGLGSSEIKSLRQIGIQFEPETGLVVKDDAKLTTALNDNLDEVAALFNSEKGIVEKLTSDLDKYTGPNGTVSNITKSYSKNISYLNDKMKSTNQRIDKSAEILRKKYQDLQAQYAAFLDSANMFNSLGMSGGGGFF